MSRDTRDTTDKDKTAGDRTINTVTARYIRQINMEQYDFTLSDLLVAEAVKAYLMGMDIREAAEALKKIVDPRVIQVDFAAVNSAARPDAPSRSGSEAAGMLHPLKHIPQSLWADINGAELALLIDSASRSMARENKKWLPEDDTMKRVQAYLDDVFRNLSGQKYVNFMPVEMAAFITDCFLVLKYGIRRNRMGLMR